MFLWRSIKQDLLQVFEPKDNGGEKKKKKEKKGGENGERQKKQMSQKEMSISMALKKNQYLKRRKK